MPYCWSHWIEFFPQLQRLEAPYQSRAQGLAMRYGRHIYDMDAQRDRIASWERVASAWAAEGGQHRLADLPHGPEDEGIVVAEVMASVIDDRRELFVVNTINDGLIPNLPSSVAVEVPAVIDAEGVHPVGIGNLPPGLAAVLSRHAQVEELTAEAAMSGSRSLLRQAMAADPLLDATLEPPQIEALTAEMLAVNARYLPQFGSHQSADPASLAEGEPDGRSASRRQWRRNRGPEPGMTAVAERPVTEAAAEISDKPRLKPGTIGWLLPAAALVIGLFLVPVAYAIYLGFTNLELLGPYAQHYSFTGLANVAADDPRSDVLVERQAHADLRHRVRHHRADRAGTRARPARPAGSRRRPRKRRVGRRPGLGPAGDHGRLRLVLVQPGGGHAQCAYRAFER